MITIKNAGACGPQWSRIEVETDTVERGPVISLTLFRDTLIGGIILDLDSVTKLHAELGAFLTKHNPKMKPSLFSGTL